MLDSLPVLFYYLQTRNKKFSCREALDNYQKKKLEHLLKFVLPRSAYMRQRFSHKHLDSWKTLPLMNKAEMMANFDALNTVGVNKVEAFKVAQQAELSRDFQATIKGFTVGLSSGTSGSRGLFLISRQERLRWAGAVLAKALDEPLWKKQRIAFFLRANSNLYTTVRSSRLAFKFYDLYDDIHTHITSLKQFQPTILVAPPSMLRLLAQAVTLNIKPNKVIAVAETLEPVDEAIIQKAFGQVVHQIYQATEGFLATTCKFGTVHLNEDLLMIERDYLDEQKQSFVPIITDLFRFTQPIIRYRLNDVLTLKQEPCPCASVMTALEHIQGRCDDLMYLRSHKENAWRIVFPDAIRRAIIQVDEAIYGYHVWQRSAEQIDIYIEPNTEEQKVKEALNQLFKKQACRLPAISFLRQLPERSPTQKLRRIQRCFPEPDSTIIVNMND